MKRIGAMIAVAVLAGAAGCTNMTPQQQGPMSHDALTAAWREGKLNLSTYVWNEELPEWKPLEEFVKS